MSMINSMAGETFHALTGPGSAVGQAEAGPMEAAHQSAYQQRMGSRQALTSQAASHKQGPLASSLLAAKGLLTSAMLGDPNDEDSYSSMLGSDDRQRLETLESDHSVGTDTYKSILEGATSGLSRRRQMQEAKQKNLQDQQQRATENDRAQTELSDREKATARSTRNEALKSNISRAQDHLKMFDSITNQAQDVLKNADTHTTFDADGKPIEDTALTGARNFFKTRPPEFSEAALANSRNLVEKGGVLDVGTAKRYLSQANGDKALAAKLSAQDGWLEPE